MNKLLKVKLVPVAIGTVIYCVSNLVLTAIVNILGVIPSFGFGLIAYLPYFLAGFFTAIKSHPSGVFNSAIVGILAGVFTIVMMLVIFGEMPPSYDNNFQLLGMIGTTVLYCSIGGILGEVRNYYSNRHI